MLRYINRYKKVILISSLIIFSAIIVFLILFFTVFFDKKFNIEKIDIQFNGVAVNNYSVPFGSDDVELSVAINRGELKISDQNQPDIEWQIIGDSLGCTIDKNILNLKECDTLGQTAIEVKVTSKNIVTARAVVNVTPKENSVLNYIELVNLFSLDSIIEGQPVNKSNLEVVACFDGYSVKINDYKVDKEIFLLQDRELQIDYSYENISKSIIIPIAVEQKSLQYIDISKIPDKTHYIEGEKFDKSGIEITAYYEYSHQKIDGYYFDEDKILSIEDKSIIIYFSENHNTKGLITKQAEQPIRVRQKILQAISVDTSNVKLDYVQGQRFDASNLVVTAIYDFGEQIITDYIIDTDTKLTHEVENWELKYTENYVTLSYIIKINVDLPYTNFRKILIEDYPEEVTLSWEYFYMTDEGEEKIDNTAFLEHDLAFNEPIGTYIIPVGAEVTIEANNPAILDFYLDGEAQEIEYPTRTIMFSLANSCYPLSVSLKRISGRSTIIFKNDVSKVVFSYPIPWNGRLKKNDLEKLAFAFDEENLYYYNAYYIDGYEYSFAELSSYIFSNGDVVTVESKERKRGTEITLKYWEGVEVLITVDKSDTDWKSKLPQIERIGYKFEGWVELDEKLVAQWNFIEVNYSGEFIGEWYCTLKSEVAIAQCIIKLKSNGTYEYTTFVNDKINVYVNGFYTYNTEENKIEIINVESDCNLLLISPDCFNIELGNPIDANLLVVEGYELYQYEAHFSKNR